MKTVHRTIRRQGFVTLSNDLLRDERLSYRARGILAMMLSHAEDWNATMEWIEEHGREGREAIRGAMKELVGAGYVQKLTTKNERGQFDSVTWIWYDTPQEPDGCLPDGTPTDGNPPDGKPSSKNTIGTEDNKTETPIPPKGASRARPEKDFTPYSADFHAFWGNYPNKVGKGAAWKAWERVRLRPPIAKLLEAVNAAIASPQWQKQGGQFIPHPATWLNQRRWEDEGLSLGEREEDRFEV